MTTNSEPPPDTPPIQIEASVQMEPPRPDPLELIAPPAPQQPPIIPPAQPPGKVTQPATERVRDWLALGAPVVITCILLLLIFIMWLGFKSETALRITYLGASMVIFSVLLGICLFWLQRLVLGRGRVRVGMFETELYMDDEENMPDRSQGELFPGGPRIPGMGGGRRGPPGPHRGGHDPAPRIPD